MTKEAKNLFPTELGEMVDEIMKTYFPDIVDIDFTANMEKRLDDVKWARRNGSRLSVFYPDFKKSVENAAEKLEKIEIKDEEKILSARNAAEIWLSNTVATVNS